MKISFKQFLDLKHSWGTVGVNIATEMKRKGHEIFLCSTNGYKNFPKYLEENIVCKNCTTPEDLGKRRCTLSGNFDVSISYTMMSHFPDYLKYGRNRFGIWCYDGTVISAGHIKAHHGATKLLPCSEFAKTTFKNCGVPESKLFVVPHGYDKSFVDRDVVYKLKTDRKRKILINIQQCHTRKNISGILDVWGKTFTNKDDVVLVAKVKDKKPESTFEVSWKEEYERFNKKYRDHAPVLVISEFIDEISDLYRACDIVFSMSNVECFLLPAAEGIASNKIVIASGGDVGCGNIDFMNEDNSLLIKGKTVRAPNNFQYWKSSVYGEMFEPNKEHASELLLKAVNEYDYLKDKFAPGMEKFRKEYTWENVVNQIISLVE